MRSIRYSAAWRIAALHSVAVALTTVLLGTGVYAAVDRQMTIEFDRRIADDAYALARHYHRGGRPLLLQALARRARGEVTPSFENALFDRAGHRIAGSPRVPATSTGWQRLLLSGGNGDFIPTHAYAFDLPDHSRLVVAADSRTIDDTMTAILRLFGLAFAVVAGIGLLCALGLGRYLNRRLSDVARTAEAIMAGDIARRMVVGRRHDEFDRLSAVLNAMLDRIAVLLDNLRQVSNDIAHDLRTPLARLRNDLERGLAQRGVLQMQDRVLHDGIRQLDEVLHLFEAMLQIAEIEAAAVRGSFMSFDLAALTDELCASYAPVIEAGGRALAWDVADASILGNPDLVAQILVNLIENAEAHTPVGTRIAVDLVRRDMHVILRVADDGPGVPAADRSRILKRFVRLERSRACPGHGLGLSLVSAIATAHDAALTIADAGPGLSVVLAFPAVSPDHSGRSLSEAHAPPRSSRFLALARSPFAGNSSSATPSP